MNEVTIFAATLFGSGIVFVGLGIPLFQRRVPPNAWYGCRTKKALSDEQIWYAVNRVTGKSMIAGGAVMTFASVALFWFREKVRPDYAAIVVISLLVLSVVLMVVNSIRAQKRW
jgi:uncharacterized membrane protein